MKKHSIQIKQFGEKAILIEWQSKIDYQIFDEIVAFKNAIQSEEIIDFVIAYNSLTLKFAHQINFTHWKKVLKKIDLKENKSLHKTTNHWKIPVCFEPQLATDLQDVATQKNIATQTFIELYCATTYTLSFYGFQPGFPYLSNLAKSLAFDRKEIPQKVLAGTVAIGGAQTGIYPSNSLGGWHVIGNTPITLFNIKNNPPCFINAGDFIDFYPINVDDYQHIKHQFDTQTFDLNLLKI